MPCISSVRFCFGGEGESGSKNCVHVGDGGLCPVYTLVAVTLCDI